MIQSIIGTSFTGGYNPQSPSFRLMFTDISFANGLVGDALNVNDWNTYLDLPALGTPFTSVEVSGDEVALYGGAGITLKEEAFIAAGGKDQIPFLLSVNDEAGVITELQDLVFSSQSLLTTVSLPQSVNAGEACFGSCTNLVSINFPLLETTGNGCFSQCIGLTSISFPQLVTAGPYCFANCIFTSVNLPQLTLADDASFKDCTFTSITLPQLVTAGGSCFEDCINLTTVSLPQLVTAGFSCFRRCDNLTSISVPQLTNAGEQCFSECIGLTSLSFPQLVTAGSGCFGSCTGLISISFPQLETLGNICFGGCTALTTLSLPQCTELGETVLNNSVFFSIIGKTIQLTIPAALMTCNAGNPDGDIQYLQSNNTVTIITTFRLMFTDISFANTLVGDATNVNDWNTYLDLPLLGTPFTSVQVAGNEVILRGGAGITLKTEAFTINLKNDEVPYLVSVDDESGVIVELQDSAFSSQSLLTTVSLPQVVTIDDECFNNCDNLAIINLPKLTTAGVGCFNNCDNLAIINLPQLTTAGSGCFAGCSLTTVTLPLCTNLGGGVFDDNVFSDIIGNTISLTIPAALMTCNAGNPDGDIQYLQANNTVTITQV